MENFLRLADRPYHTARAIAAEPEVLLMDVPTSAIDPVGTLKIEELMDRLRKRFTIVTVTHNMQAGLMHLRRRFARLVVRQTL